MANALVVQLLANAIGKCPFVVDGQVPICSWQVLRLKTEKQKKPQQNRNLAIEGQYMNKKIEDHGE